MSFCLFHALSIGYCHLIKLTLGQRLLVLLFLLIDLLASWGAQAFLQVLRLMSLLKPHDALS